MRLRGVSLAYSGRTDNHRQALAEVELSVGAGQIVAVCGRNGAGKTTLLDVLTGFRSPDSGTVRVLGVDPWRSSPDHRARVGVGFADTGLPPAASVRRLMTHLAAMHRAPERVDDLVDALNLGGLLRRRIRRLSTGERQRVTVACALIGRPDVLVLDEPTSALDTAGRRSVLDLLADARSRGAAVVWTSHTLTDVARASDRVVVLEAGRVLADETPGDLAGAADVVRFDAAPARDMAGLSAALPSRLAIREAAPGRYEVVGERVDASVLATVSTWQAANAGSGRLSVGPRDLEDVLVGLVADHASGGVAASAAPLSATSGT